LVSAEVILAVLAGWKRIEREGEPA
jgi:hypothetical protein